MELFQSPIAAGALRTRSVRAPANSARMRPTSHDLTAAATPLTPSAGAESLTLALVEQFQFFFECVERVRIGNDRGRHHCQQHQHHENCGAAVAALPSCTIELNSVNPHGFWALLATA